MRTKVVQTLFCGKIGMELFMFKREILGQEPEDIFSRAYEIDAKVTIYEMLLEIHQDIPVEALQVTLSFPELLDYVYFLWLKEDSHMEELQSCIWKGITGFGGGRMPEDGRIPEDSGTKDERRNIA